MQQFVLKTSEIIAPPDKSAFTPLRAAAIFICTSLITMLQQSIFATEAYAQHSDKSVTHQSASHPNQRARNNIVDKYGYPWMQLDELLRNRQERAARNLLDTIRRRPGDEDDMRLWQFACLATEQDFEKAKVVLSKVKSFDMATRRTLLLAASTYLQLQEYENSIRICQLAIKRDPAYEDIHSLCGDAYNALDRHEDAIKCFEAAAKANPRRAKEFYTKAAFLLMGLKQEPRALSMLNKVQITTNMLSDASYYLAKSTCLAKLNRPKEVVETANKGVAVCKICAPQDGHNSDFILIRLLLEREKAYKAMNNTNAARADHIEAERISKSFEDDLIGSGSSKH